MTWTKKPSSANPRAGLRAPQTGETHDTRRQGFATALADLYQRLERTVYDWQHAHPQAIAEGLSIADVNRTLIHVLAQMLVDHVNHLEPENELTMSRYAEQMGSDLMQAMLVRIANPDGDVSS